MIKCVTSIQEMSEEFTWRSRKNLLLTLFPSKALQVLIRVNEERHDVAHQNRNGHANETVEQVTCGRDVTHNEQRDHTHNETGERRLTANAREDDTHEE